MTREFHTKESLVEAAKWIAGCDRYFLQSFVNSGDLIGEELTGYTKAEMEALADAVRPILPAVALRGV